MKYYRFNSIPLEEDFPGINELSFDQYGNFVQIDAFGDGVIIKQSVLKDDERIDEYQNEIFLKGFWAQTQKMLKGYEIQDTDK